MADEPAARGPAARCSAPLVAVLTAIDHERIARLFGADVAAEERISSEELRLIVEQGGEQGILEAEEEQMIHAVIELGDQRVHEVMVPRIAMVSLAVVGDVRGGHRHGRRAGPLAHPRLRDDRSTRSSASSTPRTCCRSSRPGSPDGPRSARCCGRRCSCPSR